MKNPRRDLPARSELTPIIPVFEPDVNELFDPVSDAEASTGSMQHHERTKFEWRGKHTWRLAFIALLMMLGRNEFTDVAHTIDDHTQGAQDKVSEWGQSVQAWLGSIPDSVSEKYDDFSKQEPEPETASAAETPEEVVQPSTRVPENETSRTEESSGDGGGGFNFPEVDLPNLDPRDINLPSFTTPELGITEAASEAGGTAGGGLESIANKAVNVAVASPAEYAWNVVTEEGPRSVELDDSVKQEAKLGAIFWWIVSMIGGRKMYERHLENQKKRRRRPSRNA